MTFLGQRWELIRESTTKYFIDVVPYSMTTAPSHTSSNLVNIGLTNSFQFVNQQIIWRHNFVMARDSDYVMFSAMKWPEAISVFSGFCFFLFVIFNFVATNFNRLNLESSLIS